MIKRILCWLGWHKWYKPCWFCIFKEVSFAYEMCRNCGFEDGKTYCKYCGKVKR